MSTIPKRKRTEEEEGDNKDPGGGEVPSTSRINPMEDEIDQGALERAMVEYYRELNKKKKDSIVSMIVYRMNVWKGPDQDQAEEPRASSESERDKLNSDILPLDRYEGRKDFWVEIADWKMQNYTMISYGKFVPRMGARKEKLRVVCGHQKVSAPHCKITGSTYLDDFIYIEDLESQYGTFINGEKMPSGGRKTLVDGDMIGLGAPHDSIEHWGEDKGKRGFVFKVKNLRKVNSKEEEITESLRESCPANRSLNNLLILDKVMKFLSYDELKTARIVNTFWMDRANLIFPRTTVVIIADFWNQRYFEYSMEMINKHNIPNWRVDTTTCTNHENQYTENVQSLLTRKGGVVLSLRLSTILNYQRDVVNLEILLSNLPNLHTLDLLLEIRKDFLPIFTLIFTSVKNLSVKFKGGTSKLFSNNGWADHIILSLAQLFPNVKRIFDVKANFLLRVLERSNRDPDHRLWPQLTELSTYLDLHEDSLLAAIGTLPQNLTLLELKKIEWLDNSGLAAFEIMLQRHAASLEHLVLQFHGNWTTYADELGLLKLPSFPKLKTFEIDFTKTYDKILDGLPVHIMFPGGSSVCYKTDFPQIKTLSLMPLKMKRGNPSDMEEVEVDLQPILDVFVPKDSDTVCESMRWINFALNKENCAEDNPWFKGFVERFSRTFPNVNHPQVELSKVNIQDK